LESDRSARGTASASVVVNDTRTSVARRGGLPVKDALDAPYESGRVPGVLVLFVGALFAAFCALTFPLRTRFNPGLVIGAT
jgi:hypothetical protein